MARPQTLSQRVIRGSITALFLTFIGSILAYVIRIFYSRTLSIESYGLFYAVFGLFNIVSTYSDLGFGYSIAYLLPKYIKSKNYLKVWNIFIYGLTIPLVISVVISAILILSAHYLSINYFKVPDSENLVYLFCIYLIAFTILNALIQVFSGLQKEKYYSSITIFRWLFSLIFSFIFFSFNLPRIIYFALAIALGHLLTAAVFFNLLHKNFPIIVKNKIVVDSKILKKMIHLSAPTLLTTLISSFAVYSDTFFLTLFRGVKEVGIYNVIYPLASMGIVLLAPLNNFLLPLVSHLMEGEKKKISFLVNKILEIFPFIGVYFSLFIIMFPATPVGLIFGKKWLGLVELPLIIVAVAIINIPTANILGTVVLGLGRVQDRLKALGFMTGLNISINAVLVYKLGVLGVAISSIIMTFLLVIICLVIIKRDVTFKIPIAFYLKLILISSLLYIFTKWLGFIPQGWFEYILSGVFYSAVFIAIGYFLKVFDKRILVQLKPKR